ncbi:MAG: quinone oxidoreductase family protein [Acidimicrobiia bacterium]
MSETMRAWRTHEYGAPLDVLRLDEVAIPEPDAGEVRVQVEAIPLNLNDLERITGGNMMVRPDLPYPPGMEVMGIVDAVGPGVDTLDEGDRVVAMPRQAYGGYAEYAVCPAVAAFEIPDDIDLPDAAALYFPFHLAWLGLIDRAEIAADETVLVHAAAGGAGSAAVQLARDEGARVIAAASTDEKLALASELGAEHTINSSDTDVAAAVLELTDGRGVDVVFDTLGGPTMTNSLTATAYNGRYVMIGAAADKTTADEPFIVPRTVMGANVRLCGVLLAYAVPEIRALVKQAMGFNFLPHELGERITGDILDRVRAGRVRAVVGETVGFDDIPAAITAMAERRTMGRTVVMLDR